MLVPYLKLELLKEDQRGAKPQRRSWDVSEERVRVCCRTTLRESARSATRSPLAHFTFTFRQKATCPQYKPGMVGRTI